MKTPRELLFDRHHAAGSKLDAIRQTALESLAPAGTPRRQTAAPGWRDLFVSVRWHLAGLGTAWVLVALLSADSSPGPAAAISRQRTSSPLQLLTALRENRRQLLEFIEPAALVSEPVPAPHTLFPPRRGELQPTTAMV